MSHTLSIGIEWGERERFWHFERERERHWFYWERLIDWLIELYFSTVKRLAQRPTHISAVATVLLITKTFTVKYYEEEEKQASRQLDTGIDCDVEPRPGRGHSVIHWISDAKKRRHPNDKNIIRMRPHSTTTTTNWTINQSTKTTKERNKQKEVCVEF